MSLRIKILITTLLSIAAVFVISCNNPFAPGLEKIEQEGAFLGDQKTIEGVFKNFRYAYTFRDTVVYGKLLHDDFTFIYRNYDKGVDQTWGRDEDMRATSRMFNGTQNLDLIWNDIVIDVGDSTLRDVSRSFILTITFSASDVVNIHGRANFRLKRQNTDEIWKILQWRDESNY